MAILVSALLAVAAVVLLARLPPPKRPADRATWYRRGLVALLLLLPLAHATAVVWGARERLRVLRFDYVGKQLSFGPSTPVTAGGSPGDAGEVEDLNAARLPPASLRLEPLPEEYQPAGEVETPAALLVLSSPSPAVRVGERYLNSVPLEDGDEIVVTPGSGEAVSLIFRDGGIHREAQEEGEVELQGRWSGLLGGAARVYELQGLAAELGAAAPGAFSFLHRPEAFGPWHLLIRSQEVTVVRGGEVVAGFAAAHEVPASFRLTLAVVLNRTLRAQRQDELMIGKDQVEVRFDEPWRWAYTVPPERAEVDLALVVPSSFASTEMIELPEPSSRFRGLSALYRYDRRADGATLAYLGDRQEVTPGGLYALGRAGGDRMLLRLDRQAFPWHLLLDLTLLALFLAIFLGKGMEAHAGLAAVVGPVALLLGHRLLFSHKAATQPPHFAIEPFQEARLALWLVPALLLAAWTAAWLVRRPARRDRPDESQPSLGSVLVGPLGWPLLGLVVAAIGCWVVSAGGGAGRRALALLPLLLALALVGWVLLVPRSGRVRSALDRARERGVAWSAGWATLAGVAILAVRFVASGVGMPETLRFPLIDFRLLWTVVQLPIAAVVVGLGIHHLSRPSPAADDDVDPDADTDATPVPRRRESHLLRGLVDLGLFLALAFVAVALLVGDTGLLLAHALAPLVALLLLVGIPLAWHRVAGWKRVLLAALPAVPLLLVLAVNAQPELLVHAFGWGTDSDAAAGAAAPVRDTAAQLSSNRAQQLFRLYMLARPEALSEVGLEASERVAVHYQTLQSYADQGGLWGDGFLSTELPRHLGITYFSDLVPMVFVLPDFGGIGLLGLALLYVGLVAAVAVTLPAIDEADELGGQGLHVALVALLAIAMPSLYMILANLNLVLFTGKNMTFLSLNSLSDVLEGGALAALAVLGLGLRRGVTSPS